MVGIVGFGIYWRGGSVDPDVVVAAAVHTFGGRYLDCVAVGDFALGFA